MTSEVTLKLKKEITGASLEAEVISPNVFAGKTIDDIKGLKLWKGNKQVPIEDYFEISGELGSTNEETKIILEGDLSKVKHIGEGMTAGEILIKGNAGMHTAAKMKGGKVTVEGNVDDWAGVEMKGGSLTILGNTRNYLGAAYRGSSVGMQGGTITVEGNCGTETGEWMKKGTITVKGKVGSFAGIHMQGGLLILHDFVAERVGAEMKKGIIIIHGKVEELLPSFKFDSEVTSAVIDEEKEIEGAFLKFVGDMAEGGKGEIYLSKETNSHLINK
ncbi:MAG: formylmethanofuran dehydrogenase subunit C [Promethearchaeota archaeon]